jgi:hypothetical protein
MNAEQIIADIEWLEHLFSLPDNRTLQTADWKVEQQEEDEDNEMCLYLVVSNSWPWLRLRRRPEPASGIDTFFSAKPHAQ